MKSERGSAPVWFLGLSLCVLMVGAMSAELWRPIGERQEMVAMADAAAARRHFRRRDSRARS